MKKQIFIFCLVATCYLLSASCFADDCLSFKTNPTITIEQPEWSREVVQPLKPMDLLHGNVVATLVENFEIGVDTVAMEDGFCISLKTVNGTIGYSDFLVQIDARHIPNSCTYNAILSHEDEHIRAYLSIVDDYKNDIRGSVETAANSIMPVFVNDLSKAGDALDIFQTKIQSHPEIILMKQKISAAEEIRNKYIDQQEHGTELKRCMN